MDPGFTQHQTTKLPNKNWVQGNFCSTFFVQIHDFRSILIDLEVFDQIAKS